MEEVLAYFEEENNTFYASTDVKCIPFLPVNQVFRNGTELVLRNCREGEDEIMYKCLMVYADRGEGYTREDFPTLYVFRGCFLRDHYVAVIENPSNADIVGYLLIGNAECIRSMKQMYIGDTRLLIEPKYQSSGFGVELMEIGLGIMKDMGYSATLSDLHLSNLPMFNDTTRLGYSKIGVIPNVAYMEGEGWQDSVCSHYDLTKGKSFINDINLPPKAISDRFNTLYSQAGYHF